MCDVMLLGYKLSRAEVPSRGHSATRRPGLKKGIYFSCLQAFTVDLSASQSINQSRQNWNRFFALLILVVVRPHRILITTTKCEVMT